MKINKRKLVTGTMASIAATTLVKPALAQGKPIQLDCGAGSCGLAGWPGVPIRMTGTEHIWMFGDAYSGGEYSGTLHWVGDTRALAGRSVLWNHLTDLSYMSFRRLRGCFQRCSFQLAWRHGTKTIPQRFDRCSVGHPGPIAAPGQAGRPAPLRRSQGGGQRHPVRSPLRLLLADDAPRPATLANRVQAFPPVVRRWDLGAGQRHPAPPGPGRSGPGPGTQRGHH